MHAVQTNVVLKRIPRRATLLGFLYYSSLTPSNSTTTYGLYRCLQWPHLRFAPSRYPRRRRVNLLLAQAGQPNSATVPNVVGLTVAAANAAIIAASMTQGAIMTEINLIIPAGIVIAQSIMPGFVVATNTPLQLIVSAGPPSNVGFRVQAVTAGEYGGLYYEPGDVFDITQATDFSDSTVNYQTAGGIYVLGWMRQVPPSTPLFQFAAAEDPPLFPAVDPDRTFIM